MFFPFSSEQVSVEIKQILLNFQWSTMNAEYKYTFPLFLRLKSNI